jgi:hypothetical protein
MVTSYAALMFCRAGYLLAAEDTRPVLEQLDKPQRAAVIMALLALVLTGLVMVACTMLGANWVRRMARHRPGSSRTGVAISRSSNERVREALQEFLPVFQSADTIHMDPSTKETKVDQQTQGE